MTFRLLFPVLLFSMVLAACSGGGSNNVSAVTALPAVDTAAQPTMTSTPVAITGETSSETLDSNPVDPAAFPTVVVEFAGLEPGVSRERAMATDVAMSPDLDNPMQFDSFPVPITFSEFYDGYNMQTGLIRSNMLESLDGQMVVMEGYVAPPLKPLMDFFVLTRVQLAYCPFCSTATEWPDDIALVYLPEQELISTEFPVRVIGRMEVGASVDAETGMVSLVRIYAETIEPIN